MRRTVCVIASAATIAGCGGAAKPATNQATPSRYQATLALEQQRLAAAERAIPAHPRTPAALARSIKLLATAVSKLGDDLSAINPPQAVRPAHSRLVSIVRSYESTLYATAQEATRPGREAAAASALVSSTTAASGSFTGTVSEINAKLKP